MLVIFLFYKIENRDLLIVSQSPPRTLSRELSEYEFGFESSVSSMWE